MRFPPTWKNTEQIDQAIHELEILKAAFTLVPINQPVIKNLRRASLLKSSLFSARIEGNPLEYDDISKFGVLPPEKLHKREIFNLNHAYTALYQKKDGSITTELLKELHAWVMDGLSGDAGQFRIDELAIYNQAGSAIYLAPAPQKIHALLDAFYIYNTTSLDPVLIKIAIAHIWFEKIHPFSDGNGRVGRLITAAMLKQYGYDFSGIVPIEEYLDTHRQAYYDVLLPEKQDVTEFIEFFLIALLHQANKSLNELKNVPNGDKTLQLLPRRKELVEIIKEHQIVSFDFLSRRFRAIPKATLHNDLMQLTKGGFIRKLGSTRGVVYTIV